MNTKTKNLHERLFEDVVIDNFGRRCVYVKFEYADCLLPFRFNGQWWLKDCTLTHAFRLKYFTTNVTELVFRAEDRTIKAKIDPAAIVLVPKTLSTSWYRTRSFSPMVK